MAKKKSWVAKVMAKPGAKGGLHKSLGIPSGEKIPASKIAAAAKQPGKVGRQARLAQTLKAMTRKRK